MKGTSKALVLVLLVSQSFEGYISSQNRKSISPSKNKVLHFKEILGSKLGSVKVEEEELHQSIKISSQIELPSSEGLNLVMEAVRVIWSAIVKGLFDGFFPVIERVRRDTSSDWSRSFLLDWMLDTIGALIGRQRCSQKIACRTGKVMQEKLPGAQLVMIMFESFIPPAVLDWYGIVRQSVIDRSDSCAEEYRCDFS